MRPERQWKRESCRAVVLRLCLSVTIGNTAHGYTAMHEGRQTVRIFGCGYAAIGYNGFNVIGTHTSAISVRLAPRSVSVLGLSLFAH